nr:hypothetical protein [Tanacetum cinerariifolium]
MKVVVTEDVIRQDLHFDDADGVECLPNEECVSAKRTVWNEFSYYMASPIICLATVDDLTSHNTKYTSLALTQKVFANMRRVGEEVEVPNAPTPPSPTNAPLSPPQYFIPTSPQAKPSTPHASPPHEQPSLTTNSSMSLLTTLMETCTSLSKKVTDLERDKKLKPWRFLSSRKGQRRGCIQTEGKIEGRIDQDVSAATKDVSAAEPTMFDDEEEIPKSKEETVSIAQARRNMIIYLKKMAGCKMEHFRDVEEPSKKRVAEETLLQESFKKLKAVEVLGFESTQETPSNDLKEISEEDVQNMLETVPVSEFKVEALQVKVGGITEAYQSFEYMLKGFDKQDLVTLWNLVKEKFSSAVPNVDKEKALWIELKRLFEPNAEDVL